MQLSLPKYKSDSNYSSKPSTVAAVKRAGKKSRPQPKTSRQQQKMSRQQPISSASRSPQVPASSQPQQVPWPIPSHLRSAKETGVTTEGFFLLVHCIPPYMQTQRECFSLTPYTPVSHWVILSALYR